MHQIPVTWDRNSDSHNIFLVNKLKDIFSSFDDIAKRKVGQGLVKPDRVGSLQIGSEQFEPRGNRVYVPVSPGWAGDSEFQDITLFLHYIRKELNMETGSPPLPIMPLPHSSIQLVPLILYLSFTLHLSLFLFIQPFSRIVV